MKKITVLLLIILMIVLIGVSSYAYMNTIDLNFEVTSNENNEQFDVFLLLPEKYFKKQ